MILDLVDQERFRGQRLGFPEQCDREIADADVPGQPPPLDVVERPDGLAQRDPRVGPVDQEQIGLGPQPAQALVERALQGRPLASAPDRSWW